MTSETSQEATFRVPWAETFSGESLHKCSHLTQEGDRVTGMPLQEQVAALALVRQSLKDTGQVRSERGGDRAGAWLSGRALAEQRGRRFEMGTRVSASLALTPRLFHGLCQPTLKARRDQEPGGQDSRRSSRDTLCLPHPGRREGLPGSVAPQKGPFQQPRPTPCQRLASGACWPL